MEKYGIKNITKHEWDFEYDKHYRQVALKLKEAKTENERNAIKDFEEKELSNKNNVVIDPKVLKENFINLILDKDSAKYLWILYSKYHLDGENYIDKISEIFKNENKVIRGGTNTYKMNGWMAHSLYVYQIVNYNIVNNKELSNFNGDIQNKKQIQELNEIYHELNIESQFVLKIFSLIHDIGAIEGAKNHDINGMKYVTKVLNDIGITQNELEKNDIKINLKDLIQILETFIKYHTLITSLSTEGSDKYVEMSYRDLIISIPNIENIKNNIPKILLILAYGDIIAVDDYLMNVEKYNRVKEGYYFFNAVTQNKIPTRDKEKVAIERICDMVGNITYDYLKESIDDIFNKYKINKSNFINDMYNIRMMKFAGPVMKTVNNIELTIRIYNEIFEIIRSENQELIKEYIITFVPDKHENDFTKQFENGNFFKCSEMMKNTKENEVIYEAVKIKREHITKEKNLYISIV